MHVRLPVHRERHIGRGSACCSREKIVLLIGTLRPRNHTRHDGPESIFETTRAPFVTHRSDTGWKEGDIPSLGPTAGRWSSLPHLVRALGESASLGPLGFTSMSRTAWVRQRLRKGAQAWCGQRGSPRDTAAAARLCQPGEVIRRANSGRTRATRGRTAAQRGCAHDSGPVPSRVHYHLNRSFVCAGWAGVRRGSFCWSQHYYYPQCRRQCAYTAMLGAAASGPG